jgi:3-hydroxybutyryl-CoA dehydrogenase
VTLFDVSRDYLQRGLTAIGKQMDELIARNKLTPIQKEEAQDRITSVTKVEEVRADLVIEAIIERLEAKQELFVALEKVNARDVVFASNTSSISITKIADVLMYPGRFVGVHFFNPAHVMKLVEVIEGKKTDRLVMEGMVAFVKSLHKVPVTAKDSPGFIVNRVARHYYLEALKQVEHQAADVSSIDKLLRSAGFKMGPFELMDLIGVDINLAVSTSVYEAFDREIRFKPSVIQQDLVQAGNLGRKTGKGFYDYSKK